MRKDKDRAVLLRQQGHSYHEIERHLNIPRSTLSDWLRNAGWSKKIKEELTNKAKLGSTIRLANLTYARKKRLAEIYSGARAEARREFEDYKFHPLFIVGIALYWGEGDRVTRNLVRIANIDPKLIRLFIDFLRRVCGVEHKNIRAHILLYPDLEAEVCKNFWIANSGLTNDNFNKAVVIQGRHKTRRVLYGVCNISVASTYLKEKMRVWLELLPEEFINGEIAKSIAGMV